jgi:hypothetical protein
VTGDLDGNGGADAVSVYESGGAAHVLVQLGANGTASTTIADADASDQVSPRALGTARIGGDRDVAFVRVGSGASTSNVALYTVNGCNLVRLTWSGQNSFPIGGTVTHLDGLQCVNGGLRINSATSDDGATYNTSTQQAQPQNDTLVPVGQAQTGTMTSADPGLNALGTLDCQGVEAP